MDLIDQSQVEVDNINYMATQYKRRFQVLCQTENAISAVRKWKEISFSVTVSVHKHTINIEQLSTS